MKLQQAHDALARRDWAQANALLRALDGLDPDDTMALATSAYLVGDVDAAVRVWQAAYGERIGADDDLGAIRVAFWLGLVFSLRGEHAVAGGWVARAQRLLADEPEDIVERGYLLIHEFYGHLGRGDFGRAADTAGQMADVGRRFKDPDLIAQGLMSQGRMLIYSGRVSDGLALLDEAMVGVATDEVSPIFAGMVYCALIEACQELSDYARAVSWTRALATWCDTQPGLVPFTGQCSVHKGQVLRLHGDWEGALAEFATAERRYAASNPPSAAGGMAFVERGDVLRIRGEFDLAEEAYGRAVTLGREPQPGLTLLWLARGRTTQALSAVHRMLAEARGPVARCAALPAAVEVLVAAEEWDEARAAVEELSAIASAFDSTALHAMAAYASAACQLGAGESELALGAAREACRGWLGLDCPYEATRARVLVARALRAMGDAESAAAEFAAARAVFVGLRAAPAVRDVDRLIGHPLAGGLTERELEVLRLVAHGHSNAEVADSLYLSQKTVARHLSNIFTKLDVSSRTAAVAYGHRHGLIR
jgi:DNA-binding NarL/FixJ family response regulator